MQLITAGQLAALDVLNAAIGFPVDLVNSTTTASTGGSTPTPAILPVHHESGHKTSTKIIVGVVVGVTCFILAAALVAFLAVQRRRLRRRESLMKPAPLPAPAGQSSFVEEYSSEMRPRKSPLPNTPSSPENLGSQRDSSHGQPSTSQGLHPVAGEPATVTLVALVDQLQQMSARISRGQRGKFSLPQYTQ